MHRLNRVLQSTPTIRFLQVQDLLSLGELVNRWGPRWANAFARFCRQSDVDGVLIGLLRMNNGRRTISTRIIASILESAEFKGTRLRLVDLVRVVQASGSVRSYSWELTKLIVRNVTLVSYDLDTSCDFESNYVEEAFALAVERFVQLDDDKQVYDIFERPRDPFLWYTYNRHRSMFDRYVSHSVIDVIASPVTSREVAHAICDRIEERKIEVTGQVVASQIQAVLDCKGKDCRRLAFLAERVPSHLWETSNLLENGFGGIAYKAVSCGSAAACATLIKYMKVETECSTSCLSLLDAAHKKSAPRICRLLEAAGARHSFWYALRRESRRRTNSIMPDIRAKLEHLQCFGAIAAAAGSTYALQKLIGLGLKNRWDLKMLDGDKLCRFGGSAMEGIVDVPLLHLAASRGHSAACKLLIECLGDSKCDNSLCSEEYISMQASRIAHSLARPYGRFRRVGLELDNQNYESESDCTEVDEVDDDLEVDDDQGGRGHEVSSAGVSIESEREPIESEREPIESEREPIESERELTRSPSGVSLSHTGVNLSPRLNGLPESPTLPDPTICQVAEWIA